LRKRSRSERDQEHYEDGTGNSYPRTPSVSSSTAIATREAVSTRGHGLNEPTPATLQQGEESQDSGQRAHPPSEQAQLEELRLAFAESNALLHSLLASEMIAGLGPNDVENDSFKLEVPFHDNGL
jgi:hypothetical protein